MAERVCSFENCNLPHYARGWCKKHYARFVPQSRAKRPPCAFEGCINGRNGTTYCKSHEDQLKAGKQLAPLSRRRKIIDGMKECSDCAQILPVSAFNKHAGTIHPKCRACWSLYGRATRYGLTRDEVIDLLARPCDACGDVVDGSKKHIDHNHDSSVVRGVLCHQCNVALGMLNEDPARIRALAAYIERHVT